MVNKNLMAAVRREKRVSPQALYQRFDRIRKAYGNLISREEAAYVYASQLGIDVYKFMKNEPEFRDRVANLISKSQVVTTAKANPSKRNKTSAVQKILKIRETSLHDPLLPNRILDDAKKMAEVYPIIYVFENSVRNFVKRAMDKAFPEGWWNEKRIPSGPKSKAESRKHEEGKNLWHGKRSGSVIDYVDLDELESIINRNTETMTPYFKGLPKDLGWLTMKIKEIYPSRNVIAHNNPLSSDDIQRVRVICRDWQKQLSALKHKLEEKTQTSINK